MLNVVIIVSRLSSVSFTLIVGLPCFYLQAHAATISGPVTHFVDGDTIKVWNQPIRLLDIDTPEIAQECRTTKDKIYQCGVRAVDHLKKMVGEDHVECRGDKTDRYKRLLATCYVRGININRQMVLDGWAVKYWRGESYIEEQDVAKSSSKGLWNGSFVDPHIFRDRSKTIAAKDEQVYARDTSTEGGCLIKGNISASGKIYHTPWGSKSYKKTKIDISRGERWFCNEPEAIAAGWRAAYR